MTLRSGNPADIQQMFEQLRESSRALIKNTIQLVYFMRGAISYNEMMLLTPGERDIIADFLKERLDSESQRLHPNY